MSWNARISLFYVAVLYWMFMAMATSDKPGQEHDEHAEHGHHHH